MANGLTAEQATELMRAIVNEDVFPDTSKALGKQLMDDYYVTKNTLILVSNQLKESHKILMKRELRADKEMVLTKRIRKDADILAQAQVPSGATAEYDRIVILQMTEDSANGRIFYNWTIDEVQHQGRIWWLYRANKVLMTKMVEVE